MGLLKKRRQRRAAAKAEAKALKARARSEAKAAARNEKKVLNSLLKADAKSAKRATKSAAAAERKSAKQSAKETKAKRAHEQKLAQFSAQKALAGKLTKASVKRYLGVAQIAAPVLLPLLVQASTATRSQLDQRRAAKLGVAPADLGAFVGHGAKLSAQVAGAERALGDITKGKERDAAVRKFGQDITQRLGDLSTAIRSAEHLPAAQRKAAHASIQQEINRINRDILAQTGISTGH